MTSTALSDLRLAVADALVLPEPAPPDATVHADAVDAVSPPAYLLQWGNPWLLPSTFCAHVARLDIVCVAGRIDPAPGIETVEQMIATAINRLRAARLPEVIVQPPGRFDIGGVAYLAARLSLETKLTIPAPVYVEPALPGTFDDPTVVYDSSDHCVRRGTARLTRRFTAMAVVDVTAPPFIPVHPYLAVGETGSEVSIICAAENVEVSPEQDESTVETFCGSYTTYKPEQWTITASAFVSYGNNGLWNSLRPLVGTTVPFVFRPDEDAAVGPDNPEMTGTALIKAFPFFSGGPGEPTAIEVVLSVQGAPAWDVAP